MQSATASSQETIRRKVGRPPTKDWEAEKATLQRLIAMEWGCPRLGRHYGLTPRGIKLVLQRLGLRTIPQTKRLDEEPKNQTTYNLFKKDNRLYKEK
jgi:hypothetical protein